VPRERTTANAMATVLTPYVKKKKKKKKTMRNREAALNT
jgi:hypothetical protein